MKTVVANLVTIFDLADARLRNGPHDRHVESDLQEVRRLAREGLVDLGEERRIRGAGVGISPRVKSDGGSIPVRGATTTPEEIFAATRGGGKP